MECGSTRGKGRRRVARWGLPVVLFAGLVLAAACGGESNADNGVSIVPEPDDGAPALFLPVETERTPGGERIIRAPGSPSAIQSTGRSYGEGWRTDWNVRLIDLTELIGRVGRDVIASIDAPQFVRAEAAEQLEDDAPMMVVVVDADARAYPLSILTRHEIVNDVVGGVPLAVTYCPVCTTGLALERRVNEAVLEFGTSGLLRENDLVMYDRSSESLWQQIGGRAIVGTMVGARLKARPVSFIRWGEFRDRYPEGLVLTVAGEGGADGLGNDGQE